MEKKKRLQLASRVAQIQWVCSCWTNSSARNLMCRHGWAHFHRSEPIYLVFIEERTLRNGQDEIYKIQTVSTGSGRLRNLSRSNRGLVLIS